MQGIFRHLSVRLIRIDRQVARLLSLIVLAAVSTLHAQSLTGVWQGTAEFTPQTLRIAVKIMQDDKDNTLTATAWSLDQGAEPIPVASITREGSAIRIAIPAISTTYEGRLNSGVTTIAGILTQGGIAKPLVLTRATPATEWALPELSPQAPPMAPDATPKFEVSTIKPAIPDRGLSIHINPSGLVTTTNCSLFDLIKFAWSLNPKQITGQPHWVEDEKYDITAKPDTGGTPSTQQLKAMLRGLVAERFQLTSHAEQKELQVYAITQTKGGAKLEEDESNPNGIPTLDGSGPRGLHAKNVTIVDFANILQALVLDRPVVDQTGFGNKHFNFVLRWTPSAMAAAAADNPDAPPDIFTAFQQQLGLRLDSVRASVDVMVIDKVERPGAN